MFFLNLVHLEYLVYLCTCVMLHLMSSHQGLLKIVVLYTWFFSCTLYGKWSEENNVNISVQQSWFFFIFFLPVYLMPFGLSTPSLVQTFFFYFCFLIWRLFELQLLCCTNQMRLHAFPASLKKCMGDFLHLIKTAL